MRRIGLALVLPAVSACGVLLSASSDPPDDATHADATDARDDVILPEDVVDGRAGDAQSDAGGDAGDAAEEDAGAPDPGCGGMLNCTRYVFALDTDVRGDLGGVDGADALCKGSAKSAGIATIRDRASNFRAWVSSQTSSVNQRFVNKGTGDYVLPYGTVVATGWSQLASAAHAHAIDLTVGGMGFGPPQPIVWTATQSDGNWTSPDCDGWTTFSNAASGKYGSMGSTSGSWTDTGNTACNAYARLYCIEDD